MKDELLQIAIDAITEKEFDVKILFANIGCKMNEEDAARAGLDIALKRYEMLICAKSELQKGLEKNLEKWRVVSAGGFGCVYICPYCDKKSNEKTDYCPNCGRRLKK